MTDLHPETLVDDLVFPEGPRWRDGKLWFSDMHGREVGTVDLAGRRETLCQLETKPSGLGFLPDGSLLIASMDDRKLLRLESTGLVDHADLSGYATGPINDMVVDAHGRAYVGQFGSDTWGGEEMRETTLLMVEADGGHRAVADGLLIPNGMVITPDGKTLIVAETYRYQLTAFDIADDGQPVNKRVWAPLGEVRPDGICMDAEGCVWLATPMYPGGGFLRVAEGGEVKQRIELGDYRGTACVLGGPERRHLFMLEAQRIQPSKISGPGNGRIRVAEVPTPGAGVP